MATVKHVGEDGFSAFLAEKKVALVDFWASWCGPCRMVGPVIDQMAEEYDGKISVGKVNVDEEAALALKYQIMSIPTLVVMKKGVFEGKSIGVQDKDEVLRLLAL